MPVGLIKKLKKSKEKDGGLPEPEPVKTVDSRTGFDTYRDFYTLKNYWKAVTRNKDAGLIMMTSRRPIPSPPSLLRPRIVPPPSSAASAWGSPPMGSGGSTQASGKSSVAPAKGPDAAADAGGAPPAVDRRLPFANYRELYTMKNFWKSVKRTDEGKLASMLMVKYLQENPDNVALYPKLKGVDPKMIGSGDINVENVAKQYVQVFDDVISSVEANPADATEACKRLNSVGKLHRVKVSGMESTNFQALEQPFLYMVSEVLQDRFNDKAEQLFKKFFQFCLQYLTEGFNG
ncbi:hypothetical protein QR680_005855 [Steinernema hermaphroditum]|uniref:Globin family profile domain-containing protein n=1 Tax=Steinernema hermaphroditum TaxID=289476 RepID=A0AA39HVX0_9BILA|nr:hypothetical protein QR680_005855 [Steinernema hermaphroditum]